MNKLVNKYPYMINGSMWYQSQDFHIDNIRIIRFVDGNQALKDVSISWDISKGLKAYLVHNDEIIIAGNGSGKILANTNMSKMFDGFISLERIEGLDILDTSNVKDMSYLFHHCISLKELDLSSWDVSNVISFRGAFCCGYNQIGNAKLEKINISNWNVSNAEDMAYMFYGCGDLRQIDVSSWNVSKVKNFRHTFADCFQLKSINVKKWNTSSVITLDGIFNDCRSLKYIDISNWNTSNCKEFDQMFDNCFSLKKIIGIEKINTMNGIGFEEMFFGCKSLRSLNLSSMDTRKIDGHEFVAYDSSIQSTSNTKKMLVGCNGLRNLIIGKNFVWKSSPTKESRIVKQLHQNDYVVVSPKTKSMLPLLQPKIDKVVFKETCIYKKNDIVLYRSDNNDKLVMHRIIRVFEHGYLIQGDNARYSEYVPKENVFGVAVEIYRKDKKMKVKSINCCFISFVCKNYSKLLLQYRSSNHLFYRFARFIKRNTIGGMKK